MSLKKIALSTSVLAAIAFGGSALAQDSGYYIQGHGGANFIVQDDAELMIDGLGDFSGSYDADTGYVLGGALGKHFGNGFRSDIELTYRSNSIGDFEAEGQTFEADGDLSSLGVFLNGYYDFAVENSAFVPYIGAGLGYVNVDAEDENEGVFGYQFKGGVARPVGASGGLVGLEASYLGTSDVEFDVDGDTLEVDYGNTSLQFFYRHAL
ncbi:P44/Msp2 family outer membrane protein [Parvularcula flava]|uniref:P44/Msp2 family outer membrane protein n=1 Tax=Aquisalinus luteolus TaxID=1566827 RepID=A0A8J3ETX1_9PROT|nr:P44/Msp2 family outer membrane protein [Aquisalinus luteolus]NHK27419.1 P44/Msp2 family outer membrane protein [Aquisalinus luteolus]GGH95384.1 P44/Msp2 family outer membrane protein [Aquisalinus luteolus]